MPSSVQQTFVGRENGTDTKNGCKEAMGHIGPVLFFLAFMDLDFVSVHKN